MGIASIVHLYVFPAEPYEAMGDLFPGTVSVLGDYVSADCPVDPDEVRDSERPTKVRIPQPDLSAKSGMTLGQSVRDVFFGGGGYVSTILLISCDVITIFVQFPTKKMELQYFLFCNTTSDFLVTVF